MSSNMDGNFFAYFALILAYVEAGYSAECESDLDCVNKSTTGATRCCRDFAANSNLSCRVSTCLGHFCFDDNECSGECCRASKCTDCMKCVNDTECGGDKVCCEKDTFDEHGECRSDCDGCKENRDCDSTTCCVSGKCVNNFGCADKLIFAVSASTACFVLLLVICACVLLKYSQKSRRVSPRNVEMNGTVLTMPSTYPCTTNRTTSFSHKE